ncbi:hypothetical protein NSP_19190 [Nodularia spumigena CCY9414]|jgi:hypothetical protein|nr:hypothetical protein NSP_19190 [Nodularia spumigena CCY9414]EAW44744.1 TPR repeat protein [Nodularia spumigena CCY9414]
MDSLSINSLLEDLKNPEVTVREQATKKLWRIWFQQKGIYGLERIDQSQKLVDAGQMTEAEAILTELIKDQPDFAEDPGIDVLFSTTAWVSINNL